MSRHLVCLFVWVFFLQIYTQTHNTVCYSSLNNNLVLHKGFLTIALRIPTAHDFRVIARAKHVRNKRNFPQAKLNSEINARFLLNEHGNLYFIA